METVEQPWERRVVLVSRQTFRALKRSCDCCAHRLALEAEPLPPCRMEGNLVRVRQNGFAEVKAAAGRQSLCHRLLGRILEARVRC